MSDHYIDSNPWFPNDLWEKIACHLDNNDLATFRQLSKMANLIGSDSNILQPLYERLCAIDNTLPAELPKENALAAFKQAFENIKNKQFEEIEYLTDLSTEHCCILAKPEYTEIKQNNVSPTLASLEIKEKLLDAINSEIIEKRIDINSTSLYLSRIGITRLPTSLFQKSAYLNFWKNLTQLYCSDNRIISLDIRNLAALQELYCSNNKLTQLNVQGLAKLRRLFCNNNKLTHLNAQGLISLAHLLCHNNQLNLLDVRKLVALERLYCSNNNLTSIDVTGLITLIDLVCNNNPLRTLLLTGVHPDTQNKHAELERSLLFKKLGKCKSENARQAIIHRLGADYTYENCLRYCPIYAATTFTKDLGNGAYTGISTFLSLFDRKRKRNDVESTQIEPEEIAEEPSEDSDQEPEKKRFKKS